jgi:hypothetical protein
MEAPSCSFVVANRQLRTTETKINGDKRMANMLPTAIIILLPLNL